MGNDVLFVTVHFVPVLKHFSKSVFFPFYHDILFPIFTYWGSKIQPLLNFLWFSKLKAKSSIEISPCKLVKFCSMFLWKIDCWDSCFFLLIAVLDGSELIFLHHFFIQQYEWLIGSQYKPMELSNSDWSAIRKSPPWAIDSWGLGKCTFEQYNRQWTRV